MTKELHRGDIITLDNNGRRLYAVIVTNNSINYNSDTVGVVNITTQPPEGNPITHVDIITNQPAIVICEKVYNVWRGNIMEFVRECTTEEMNAIDKAMRIAFGLVGTCSSTTNELNDALIAGNETLGNRCATLEAQLEDTALQRDKLKCAYDKLTAEFEGLKKEAVAQSENLVQLTAENAKLRDELKDHAEMRPTPPDMSAITVERDLYKSLYEQLIDKLIGA